MGLSSNFIIEIRSWKLRLCLSYATGFSFVSNFNMKKFDFFFGWGGCGVVFVLSLFFDLALSAAVYRIQKL